MRKTILVGGCALLLCSTMTAGDFAADPLNFKGPQQDLIDKVSEVLREQKEGESCEKQQEEALQRFLSVGVPFQSAIFMAASQYPCGSLSR
jgi:hypothetical protein